MRLGRTCVLEVSAAALEEVVPAGSAGGPGHVNARKSVGPWVRVPRLESWFPSLS